MMILDSRFSSPLRLDIFKLYLLCLLTKRTANTTRNKMAAQNVHVFFISRARAQKLKSASRTAHAQLILERSRKWVPPNLFLCCRSIASCLPRDAKAPRYSQACFRTGLNTGTLRTPSTQSICRELLADLTTSSMLMPTSIPMITKSHTQTRRIMDSLKT